VSPDGRTAPRGRLRKPSSAAAPARGGRAASSGGTERVLELLRRRPLAPADLCEELEVSPTRVQQLMKPLREQGRVVPEPDPGSARPRQLWRAIDRPA
jgi:predicted ArsR family transcriptional regulator